MSLEELKRLPVPELAHPDGAFFWGWATWPKIRDKIPQDLFDHWNLRWVGEIVWNKMRIGPGRWLRSQAEVLILAVAGKPARTDAMKSQPNIASILDPVADVVECPRTPKHSEKPAAFRDLIERLAPGPRIELFARASVEGWDSWGDEAPATAEPCPALQPPA